MRRTMIALVVMVSLVSVPASAERLDNYATVKLGVYSPRSHYLTGMGFGKGIDGEFALGHYFYRHLASEFALGYFKTTAGSDQITVIPFTVTGKGILPLGKTELYAGAGVGAYFATAKSETGRVGFHSYNDTALGWHLLTGGTFNVMPNMFVGAEIKYIWAKPSFDPWESRLDGMIATANLGVRF